MKQNWENFLILLKWYKKEKKTEKDRIKKINCKCFNASEKEFFI